MEKEIVIGVTMKESVIDMCPHDRVKCKESNLVDIKKVQSRECACYNHDEIERMDKMDYELKGDLSQIHKNIVSQSALINQLDTQI